MTERRKGFLESLAPEQKDAALGYKGPDCFGNEKQPMTYHFARLQPDGRLSSPLPDSYESLERLKIEAPERLLHLQRRGGKIVIVQVLEEVRVRAEIEFIPLRPPVASAKKK